MRASIKLLILTASVISAGTLAACFDGTTPGGDVTQHDLELLLRNRAQTNDVVHGTVRFAGSCDHDIAIAPPAEACGQEFLSFALELDWIPETTRLDASAPKFALSSTSPDEFVELSVNVPAYIGLTSFGGLQRPDQADASITCSNDLVDASWNLFGGLALRDSIVEREGLDHNGLRAAVEEAMALPDRSVDDTTAFDLGCLE